MYTNQPLKEVQEKKTTNTKLRISTNKKSTKLRTNGKILLKYFLIRLRDKNLETRLNRNTQTCNKIYQHIHTNMIRILQWWN